MVAHTTLLEISCHGPIFLDKSAKNGFIFHQKRRLWVLIGTQKKKWEKNREKIFTILRSIITFIISGPVQSGVTLNLKCSGQSHHSPL